jgi:hypothetical protein
MLIETNNDKTDMSS